MTRVYDSSSERNLQHAGFDVITADGARQGLERSRDWGPDIIVLDLMMPQVDRFEVLHDLAIDCRTVVPVIILTGPDVKDDARRPARASS